MAKNLKTWTYNTASEAEKKLYMSGVPKKYWDVKGQSIEFSHLIKRQSFRHLRISAGEQGNAWHKLVESPIVPQSICIASAPTDHQAMLFASYFVKTKLDEWWRDPMSHKYARFVNSNVFPSTFIKENPQSPKIIVVYNIMEDAPAQRLQVIRDYLTGFPDSIRIAVVGSGTGNPIDFMWDSLHLDADQYFGSTQNIKHITVI